MGVIIVHNKQDNWAGKVIKDREDIKALEFMEAANDKEDMEERMRKKFDKMIEARKTPCDLRAPTKEPDWLDKESATRGRQVYFDFTTGISLSSMEALLMGMCIPNFCKPLVFSMKSHGRDIAKTRYLETAALVYSWYLADCWNTESLTSAMIRRVNAMHRFIAGKVRPMGMELLSQKVNDVFLEEEVDLEAELSVQDRVFLDNVKELRDQTHIPEEFWKYVNDSSFFSQTDMTLVQGAFFGQFLLFPRHYGCAWATKDQVRDFLHLWRANGWYLGIVEDNNAVLEDYEETKAMGKLVLEKILKPCMLYVSPESLHMSKAACFPGMDYHVVAYTNYELVGFPLPKLWASFSYSQVYKYYMRKIFVPYIYPIPGIKHILNWLGYKLLDIILASYQARGKKGEREKAKKNAWLSGFTL